MCSVTVTIVTPYDVVVMVPVIVLHLVVVLVITPSACCGHSRSAAWCCRHGHCPDMAIVVDIIVGDCAIVGAGGGGWLPICRQGWQ
jgi:hypothetical protein